MTAPHDLRLGLAAACAWVASVVVLRGTSVVAVAVAVLVCAALGAVLAAVGTRAGWRVTTAVWATCGLPLCAALTSVMCAQVWIAGAMPPALHETIGADPVVVTAQTVDAGHERRGFSGSTCMTPVKLTRVVTGAGHATPLSAPATLNLDSCVEVGTWLVVESAFDDAAEVVDGPVAWETTVLATEPSRGAVATVRRDFEAATAHLPVASRGLVRGMITGDTSSMDPSQIEALRRSGVAHITAVSGAHFAVLTLMILGAARTARLPRWGQAGVLAVVVGCFVLFVGAAPSVLRATGLACAVVAGLAWGRRARALPALCATVLVLAHLYPPITVEVGFAMSVTAVAAIVVVAPAIAVRLTRHVSPRLASAASVPVAAQLALLPFLIMLQPGTGPYAVLANLAAAVFLAPVMLCGVLAVVLGPWWMAGAQAFATLASWPATVIMRICDQVVELPGAWVAWEQGTRGVVVAVVVAITGLVACAHRHGAVRLLAGLMCGVGVAIAVVPHVPSRQAAARDWNVVACDVGQGDMMLVRAGPRSALVIDTGPDVDAARECLERYEIDHVPLLILTHPDHDHDGAVDGILAVADVSQAWVARAGENGTAASALSAAGVTVSVPRDGHTARVGEAMVEVLPGAHDGDPHVEGDNDASIVTLVTVGHTTVLALGDVEPPSQRRLATALTPRAPLVVDVVKVAHHGSAHQDPGLAEVIQARWALFSAGVDNDYGHPAASAIDLYTGHGALPLVTADCGDIAVTPTGIATARECRTDVAR